jgi:hypothetical protein
VNLNREHQLLQAEFFDRDLKVSLSVYTCGRGNAMHQFTRISGEEEERALSIIFWPAINHFHAAPART